jgi:hypothetical protein
MITCEQEPLVLMEVIECGFCFVLQSQITIVAMKDNGLCHVMSF